MLLAENAIPKLAASWKTSGMRWVSELGTAKFTVNRNTHNDCLRRISSLIGCNSLFSALTSYIGGRSNSEGQHSTVKRDSQLRNALVGAPVFREKIAEQVVFQNTLHRIHGRDWIIRTVMRLHCVVEKSPPQKTGQVGRIFPQRPDINHVARRRMIIRKGTNTSLDFKRRAESLAEVRGILHEQGNPNKKEKERERERERESRSVVHCSRQCGVCVWAKCPCRYRAKLKNCVLKVEHAPSKLQPSTRTSTPHFPTVWSSAGIKGRWKREIPEKTRRPEALSGTIPKCENPGVTRPGIEPSPWWEASRLITQPPRPRPIEYAASLLASHQGEPGSIPGWVTPRFPHVGIEPDDTTGRTIFPGISRFPSPLIPTLIHTHLNHTHQLSIPRSASFAHFMGSWDSESIYRALSQARVQKYTKLGRFQTRPRIAEAVGRCSTKHGRRRTTTTYGNDSSIRDRSSATVSRHFPAPLALEYRPRSPLSGRINVSLRRRRAIVSTLNRRGSRLRAVNKLAALSAWAYAARQQQIRTPGERVRASGLPWIRASRYTESSGKICSLPRKRAGVALETRKVLID
ncbi:hypothetical protein PR048_006078 [Dryococelus australis]|uniref:Uncharacterized protein n=1 Tax=Dryococelus australis TaxID=614101 RepID=A0ABQ9I9Y6_9NEOP|nr:hypothetical protein PR048_006078 [Dryococelus australis]